MTTGPRTGKTGRAALALIVLAAASAAGACAGAPLGERAAGPGRFEIYCGAGESRCYDRARSKCAAGEATIKERPSVKMRRDLHVVCRTG